MFNKNEWHAVFYLLHVRYAYCHLFSCLLTLRKTISLQNYDDELISRKSFEMSHTAYLRRQTHVVRWTFDYIINFHFSTYIWDNILLYSNRFKICHWKLLIQIGICRSHPLGFRKYIPKQFFSKNIEWNMHNIQCVHTQRNTCCG